MASTKAASVIEGRITSSNPLDAIPDEIPFDVAAIQVAVAEAKKQ